MPALIGPLTRGHLKGALLGERGCGTKVLGVWCYPFPEAGGLLGRARATVSGGWHPWASRSWAACTLLWPRCRPAAQELRGPTA